MTPIEKTKFKDEAQTRALAVFDSNPYRKRIDSDCYVEGYAARYGAYTFCFACGFQQYCFKVCLESAFKVSFACKIRNLLSVLRSDKVNWSTA